MIFQWEDRNIHHIGNHGVSPLEAEFVVYHAHAPFPEQVGDEKLVVWGKTSKGRFLQVVFVYLEDNEVKFELLSDSERIAFSEGESVIYVVHARDLTESEKRNLRRRTRP